ncbi:MATE family efflux transporter [Clostridium neonatale]|uniref:Drug/sodium antiporter, MATE family n=1 Tax=Clostridium neonatale TaxID=137838 RepID=A0A650MDF1_9CLOT|nr:MATE family efflux transporter [Clostridium neonatale]MBP8312465.1 MATE family efflux transporter [Clostridium neonatale]CAG9708494.1 Putative drug/sodium antiporter, MATE family [Clostridium neonatale]CAI3543581.1 putative drug/sodium antiporter, MATE family [Clostridium neonatale]CAI3553419.1 putative drug/sodium antiporter, MATE family [Clostridium neonatale]CAI3579587.1 putative drug/sodium antiporter, MATE family [Clostridium neonatale]
MTKDMTTGNPVKLILFFSIPLLIGNVFQQFYSMVDTIIVGRYVGVQALAAVGVTGSLSFLILGFTFGLTGGFSVIIAQRFGANDEDGLRKSVATSTILSIISTIIITLASMLSAKPVLSLMNTPDDIINDATIYIIIIYAGTCATVFYNMIAGILRSLGDSKTPLYFLILSSILNIILDLFFILNFNMGVRGAAYATVITQGISGILCLIYALKKYPILRLKKEDWIWDKNFALKHLNVGIPMALQFSITATGVMVLQTALNAFGSTVIAAYTAASKVEQIVTQPGISFGTTMATYCGQNLGAGKYDRIKEGVKKGSIITIMVSIIAAVVLFVFGKSLSTLFISSDQIEALNYSKQYLNTVAAFLPILGMLFIYRNSLQGIGDAFIPMMAGVAELVAMVIVAFTLPAFIGYIGICLASPFAWIGATIPMAIKYRILIKRMLIEKTE